MNLAADAVTTQIKATIPTVLITSSELIGISQAITTKITVTEIVNAITYVPAGTNPVTPEILAQPAKFKITLSDKYKNKYDLTKYVGLVNNWVKITIILHEINSNPSLGDVITCLKANVAKEIWDDTDINYDIPVDISFTLDNLIYTTWEYYPTSASLGSRMLAIAQAIKIDFTVKTKNDDTRLRIDSYVDSIVDKCYTNNMSFGIRTDNTNLSLPIIGNLRVLGKPYVNKNQSEGANIQSRTVSIIGYYNINYKN